jgi:hypothetical protein
LLKLPAEQQKFVLTYSPMRGTNNELAVSYRDYWFWVDNGDLQTKRALTVVMFFFTLADTGSLEKLPLITIPAH